MKQEKRALPTRNKATLDKFMKKQPIESLEVKKNLKKLKIEPGQSEKNMAQDAEAEEQTHIHNINQFLGSDKSPRNFNITRTQQGLCIRYTDPSERKPTLPEGTKTKSILLDTVNSLSTGPDNNLYNLLTTQGFLANLKAQEAALEKAKQKPVSCNCKKTHCLKMYCECISKGLYCNSECQCKDCFNNSVNESHRQKSKDRVFFKKSTSTKDLQDEVADKTCNCKKSGCNKKYCQCFGAGLKCSALCRCAGCKNKDPNEEKQQQQQTIFNPSMNVESINPYNIQESIPFNMENESVQGRSILFGMRDESQGRAIGFTGCVQTSMTNAANTGQSRDKQK